MKNTKRNLLASAVFTSLIGFAAASMAGPHHSSDKDVQRTVIKVKAEQGEEIKIVVGDNGERNKYEFSFEELENMDNVSAKLGDLDEETKTKVLSLLSKVQASESEVIEFKDANLVVDGEETEVFIIKTGNGEDQMHIEVDVVGEGVSGDKRMFVEKLIAGKVHGGKRHHIMKHKMSGKKDAATLIKKIIDKAELTDTQIAEIKAALEAK